MTNLQLTSYSMVKSCKHFLKMRNKTRRPPSSVLFNRVLEVLVKAIREKEEINVLHTGKSEVKLSLFVEGFKPYTENPKR